MTPSWLERSSQLSEKLASVPDIVHLLSQSAAHSSLDERERRVSNHLLWLQYIVFFFFQLFRKRKKMPDDSEVLYMPVRMIGIKMPSKQ